MPCRDYEQDRYNNCTDEKRQLKIANTRLDNFAAMLCASCELMSNEQINSVPKLREWWDEHQEADRVERLRVEKAAREAAQRKAALKQKSALKRSGLSKLSDAEIEALGIK